MPIKNKATKPKPERLRTFIVSVPVTVTVCREIKATSKLDAISRAQEGDAELVPMYLGYASDIDRPPMLQGSEEGMFFKEESPSNVFYEDGVKAETPKEFSW